MPKLSRRSFLTAAGLAPVARLDAQTARAPASSPSSPAHAGGDDARPVYTFLNSQEVAFLEAATARLIPSDETGPGAREAWVTHYIDRQLGGAWGAGERLYRGGPWHEGTPTQGYQLPFTPAELFRNAMRALRDEARNANRPAFEQMSAADQDRFLHELEKDRRDLGGVPADIFFQSLLEVTIEGYFCDPVYGGNRNMVSWQMIGFPGAYATYYDTVDHYGMQFDRKPMSLGEDRGGHVHPMSPRDAASVPRGTPAGHAPRAGTPTRSQPAGTTSTPGTGRGGAESSRSAASSSTAGGASNAQGGR